LVENDFNLVIQVNGKMRDMIRVSKDLSKEQLEESAKASAKVASSIADKTIRKVIYVPNKLMNFVVG